MARRITIVTAGHLATCPRMLKAADTLHEAGYDVKVISTSQTPWAIDADRRLNARRGWRWQCIPYDRATAPWRWFVTGFRSRGSQAIARMPGCSRAKWVMAPAFSRLHAELVRAIVGGRQDFIYGGTSGAVAAVAEASRRTGTPCAVDFEDFHCGEHGPAAGRAERDRLADAIMADVVRQAAFITAGSVAIARACEERFGVPAIAINNVFPLPTEPGGGGGGGPLRLYWFGQTIGPGRGLEDVVRAAGTAGVPCELHLRGVAIAAYASELDILRRTVAPRLKVTWHGPIDPDAMVESCRGFDVGLALETGHTLNRALCLTNKALTYPLAGLAMVLTRTPGQQVLIDHLGGDAVSYAPAQFEDLAAGLARWHEDRPALHCAREASWKAACTRWRWDHPLERDALLAAVRAAA